MFSKLARTVAKPTNVRFMANLRHYDEPAAKDFRYFTWKGMKKNYAVLPLVGIISVACIGICGFIAYASTSVTEVKFNRANPSIEESMDVLNPEAKKIRVINQVYRPMPELDNALKYKEEAKK